MTSAIDLAKHIVYICIKNKHPITNLQLQCILYHIQQYHLKRYNTPAFKEDFEAWKFGPAIPEVYYKYCHYASMPIDMQLEPYDSFSMRNLATIHKLIDEKCVSSSANMLKDITKLGSAWDKMYCKGNGKGKIIPIELIKKDSTPVKTAACIPLSIFGKDK